MRTTAPEGFKGRLTSYGDPGFSEFIRGAFLASAGVDHAARQKPVVGIVDTTSDYVTCHREMPALVAKIKEGVLEAGGQPMVFPTMSLGEILTSPTTMLYRNLMAMVVEEQIASQPMDAVVLLGGCDKTLPAEMMAAASADVPAVVLPVGPMLAGRWRGERLGACTDCRRMWTEYRSGTLDADELLGAQQELCPTAGSCMVMGTASTMACLIEAMGMMLPMAATAPAVSSMRLRIAVQTGRQAVALARHRLRPSQIMTREAFENAMVVLAAISGSTNAVIHLTAIARRLRITITLDDIHAAAQRTPLLTDVKPAGSGYLEDLHSAGGVPVLMKTLEPLLDLSQLTVTGEKLEQVLDGVAAAPEWQSTIRPLDNPLRGSGSLIALRGSLAPDGAVIKAAAASDSLMTHRGPAVVFNSPQDIAERIDDPALEITADSVLVLRGIGPAASGMPEAASAAIPRYLAEQGVRDLVRVSDGRMSGTAYGTIVLHCAPEAARGGPLGLVRDGDIIELDVPGRRIDLLVDEEELERRRAELIWTPAPQRGWRRLFFDHVLQADQGADLDFL